MNTPIILYLIRVLLLAGYFLARFWKEGGVNTLLRRRHPAGVRTGPSGSAEHVYSIPLYRELLKSNVRTTTVYDVTYFTVNCTALICEVVNAVYKAV